MKLLISIIFSLLLYLGSSILIQTDDRIMFFGDSIRFSGSLNDIGFISMIKSLYVHTSIENTGRQLFNLENFVKTDLYNILNYYKPTVAIFMITDDEMRRMLNTWLQADDRSRHTLVNCGDCEEYEETAKQFLQNMKVLEDVVLLVIREGMLLHGLIKQKKGGIIINVNIIRIN